MTESDAHHVVVVDDDVSTLRLLQKQLELAGLDVTGCESARMALAAITSMGAGLVIADWNMPDMDGIELCRTVRELEKMEAVQQIYFILLTAHSAKSHVVQGLDAGANDYLTKPYHPGELLARIQVGKRMLRLQRELMNRTIEVQKANAQMALLARKLEEQARTDSMTRLSNRRFIFKRLAYFWQSARTDEPLGCILFDIDRFKRINDTHGHAVGDAVLVHVAEVLRGTAPRPELCGRIGGEEFIVLCPATSLAACADLAEEIRGGIAASPTRTERGPIAVTVSCGVAVRKGAHAAPDDLVKEADTLLYAAKQNGRDQVRAADGTASGRRVAPRPRAAVAAAVPPA